MAEATPEPADDTTDVPERIGNALSNILGAEGQVVTKWVCIVETIDLDGERGVWAMAPEGAAAWDTLGLMQYAIQREQARLLEPRQDEEDG